MISNLKMCSGCTACISICPYNAIESEINPEGFLYPRINPDKCKNCGLCNMVCQIDKKADKHNIKTFAVQNNDIKQRSLSQSGGLFSALATVILNNCGICYGASLDDNYTVNQIRIASLEQLPLLQGSKYVQSNASGSFRKVENDLRNGNEVLYSGTSCIVDGLIRYLTIKKVNMDKLYTCDLICYGVPSPKIWKDNVDCHNKDGKLIDVKFRDKSKGWDSSFESYSYSNGVTVFENFYNEMFFSNIILRNNCYSCQYVNPDTKPADITMADFWAIRSVDIPIENDNTGISLAIVHSKKGHDLFNSGDLKSIEVKPQDGLKNNKTVPAFKPKYREIFWNDYLKHGYEYCVNKYTKKGGLKHYINKAILKLTKRW